MVIRGLIRFEMGSVADLLKEDVNMMMMIYIVDMQSEQRYGEIEFVNERHS